MTRLYPMVIALLACGTPDTNHPDSGADASPDASAPFPSPPQVQNQHGPVLTAPTVVPIFFTNDSEQSQVEDFLKQLAQSSFWSTATTEYGAGPLTVATSIVVADTPPGTIDTVGIEAWLSGYLDGTHAGWPTLDQNHIFAIFYPSVTTIDDATFGTSCTDFAGFHYQGTKATNLVYAVFPRCPSAGTLVGFDGLTATLSHELIEAATDPLDQSNPGWAFTDDAHLIWSFEPGAEIADMCALSPQSFQRLVGSYMVQRPWSNAAALAGHDPCVPPLAEPYFVAAPVLTEDVNLAFQQHYVVTKGVQLTINQSKTIAVRLLSDGQTSPWSVQAIDTTQPPGLTFSWDKQTGNSGDTLHLTITRTALTSSEIVIESQTGTTINPWFVFVAD